MSLSAISPLQTRPKVQMNCQRIERRKHMTFLQLNLFSFFFHFYFTFDFFPHSNCFCSFFFFYFSFNEQNDDVDQRNSSDTRSVHRCDNLINAYKVFFFVFICHPKKNKKKISKINQSRAFFFFIIISILNGEKRLIFRLVIIDRIGSLIRVCH